jgi:hypothetical protein
MLDGSCRGTRLRLAGLGTVGVWCGGVAAAAACWSRLDSLWQGDRQSWRSQRDTMRLDVSPMARADVDRRNCRERALAAEKRSFYTSEMTFSSLSPITARRC